MLRFLDKLGLKKTDNEMMFSQVMSGSSHIRSVLIAVEYQNCHQYLDVYLLFAILLGQIRSKLNYRLVTYKMARP